MAASASSTTISASEKYDVFLSFRGEDTRNGITSHINSALKENTIKTYMDEESLERGHEISATLLSAIERCKISVVILSKDYASSSWCLSELVYILKCRDQHGQFVLPIFYEVDPSHVRKQDQGSYKDAFNKHEENKSEMVREWSAALKGVADLAGLTYDKSIRRESDLVKDVVEVINKELNRHEIPDDDFKGLVGMKKHYTRIKSLLSIDSSRVRIISIWGMAGIGKTTIAEAIFTRLSPQFKSSYFLKNVREESEKNGLEKLRNELIAKLLGDENLNPISLPNGIPERTKDRIRDRKVLLVLDDVSKKEQLESLVSDLFSCESRIIVTTRDEGVFRGTTISADFEKYVVDLLSLEESIQLFTLKTFGENCPPTDYLELLNKGIRYVGHNPLAITVLGSHLRSLRNPTKENWEMELEKLKHVPHDDIQKVLRISYDGLNKIEQKIFLDIACFFKMWRRGLVENILNACNLFASTGIDFLVDKSLVTMNSPYDILDMHDLVQQMGWHIVREESEEPGERSRIWTVEDACYVLNNDMGTSQIEGIFLDIYMLDEDVYLKPTIFQRMNKLRLLSISYSRGLHSFLHEINNYQVHLEALDYLPQSLRYLEWYSYPLKSLPSNFNPCNLVDIKMPCSHLENLWHGIKNLNKLKSIDLSKSVHLIQISDLSCAQNLEMINLKNCTSLLQVPWHVFRKLNKLLDVNLSNCHNLGSFPDRIDARGLKSLNLNGCLNMKTVPDIICGNLVSLNMSSTPIVNLPSSIGSVKTLSKLFLMYCRLLKCLPSSISQLTCLEALSLVGCSSLEKFPELPMNIKQLLLSKTAIKEVPVSFIEDRSCLEKIQIVDCKRLESLPSSIFELAHLTSLHLSGCSNLDNLPEISNHVNSKLEDLYLDRTGIRWLPLSIGNLNKLEGLELSNCKSLELVGNMSSLLMSSLTYLSVKECKKVKRLSHLPLSLQYLDATGCSSLDMVLDSTSNEFKRRFWYHGRKVEYDTFDYSAFSECLRLDQSSVDNIITEFQLKVLQMATQHVAPKSHRVLPTPAITTFCPGEEIPNWFNYVCHGCDDCSISVTIPIPEISPSGDLLGFALCAVVAGKSCTMSTDVFCEIKLIRVGLFRNMINYAYHVFSPFTGPQSSVAFPVSDSNQVVMWYKHLDICNLYTSDAEEVWFEFLIKERSDEPCNAKLIKCGVHVLSKSDLEELGVVADHNYDRSLIEIDRNDSSDYSSSDDMAPSETSLASEIVESDTHDSVSKTSILIRRYGVYFSQHELHLPFAQEKLTSTLVMMKVFHSKSCLMLFCSLVFVALEIYFSLWERMLIKFFKT